MVDDETITENLQPFCSKIQRTESGTTMDTDKVTWGCGILKNKSPERGAQNSCECTQSKSLTDL